MLARSGCNRASVTELNKYGEPVHSRSPLCADCGERISLEKGCIEAGRGSGKCFCLRCVAIAQARFFGRIIIETEES